MDEPTPVSGVECGGDLLDDAHGALDVERAFALDRCAEVGPRHVAHRQEQPALALAGLVDEDGVRVADRRGELGRAREPLAEGAVLGDAGGDELQGGRPLEREMGRAVHNARPALSRYTLEPIAGAGRSECRIALGVVQWRAYGP